MNADSVFCSGCHALLPAYLKENESGRCTSCGQEVLVKTFPALIASRAAALPQSLQDQAEASCFYHAQNRATVPCDECGRFLCSLCALEVPGRIICPPCLEAGVSGKGKDTLETSRTMHDSIALGLATWPGLLVWPAIFTAPLALFWVIRHWKSPRSIVPRSRVRFYLAILFGTLELALVGLLIFAIIFAARATP